MARHKKTIDEKYNQVFATRFRELMRSTQTNQTELAQAIGKSRQVVSQYYNGESEPPFDTLTKIAVFYGVSTDYLLGRTDEPSPKPAAVDDLGLSPIVVDWLREFKRSSAPDEEGYIHRAGLIKNLNTLLENVNFQYLVKALCNLIDGIEAENVFYSLPYSPDLSKEIREIEDSGQYNDTVLDLLRTQNALHDNSSDIQLPGRLVFGVNVTDILGNDVNHYVALLVDSLRKRRE